MAGLDESGELIAAVQGVAEELVRRADNVDRAEDVITVELRAHGLGRAQRVVRRLLMHDEIRGGVDELRGGERGVGAGSIGERVGLGDGRGCEHQGEARYIRRDERNGSRHDILSVN